MIDNRLFRETGLTYLKAGDTMTPNWGLCYVMVNDSAILADVFEVNTEQKWARLYVRNPETGHFILVDGEIVSMMITGDMKIVTEVWRVQ